MEKERTQWHQTYDDQGNTKYAASKQANSWEQKNKEKRARMRENDNKSRAKTKKKRKKKTKNQKPINRSSKNFSPSSRPSIKCVSSSL